MCLAPERIEKGKRDWVTSLDGANKWGNMLKRGENIAPALY